MERSEAANPPRIYVNFARSSDPETSITLGPATSSPQRSNSERVNIQHRDSSPANQKKRVLKDITNQHNW